MLNEKDGIVTDPKMLPRSQRAILEPEVPKSQLEEAKKKFLEEWGNSEDVEEEENRRQLKSH